MTKQQIKSDGGATSYYDLPPNPKQLGDLIEHKNMNFNVGTIFKAAYRLGEKSGFDTAYDLRKIIWSAQRELARVEAVRVQAAVSEACKTVTFDNGEPPILESRWPGTKPGCLGCGVKWYEVCRPYCTVGKV